jgi:hypothetical protein
MIENPFKKEKFSKLPEESLTELYLNKRLELPFDPKELAVFLDRENGTVDLRVLPYHHRSADTAGRNIIKEKGKGFQNIYCQFDVKGSGFLFPETFKSKKDHIQAGDLTGYPEAYIIPFSSEDPWGYNSLGLMDERMAMTTKNMSERLSKTGMRVEGIAAIFRLSQIRLEGEVVPVEAFKKKTAQGWRTQAKSAGKTKAAEYREMARDIEEQFDPVIMIRVMRSIFRLRDLRDADTPTEVRLMVEEACDNLNVEMEARGEDVRFDSSSKEGREKWLNYISACYARNIGLLHAQGLSHLFLHMGNLSLAGEVVDLDSITAYMKKKTFVGLPDEKDSWLKKFKNDPLFRETEDGCAISAMPLMKEPDVRFGLPKPMVKDMRDLCFSVRMIIKGLGKGTFHDQYHTSMLAQGMADAYVEGLGEGSICKEFGLDIERIKGAFVEIVEQVVGRGEYYAPLEMEEDV